MQIGRHEALAVGGEVTERAELLNGMLQVVLEGRLTGTPGDSHCSSSVAWRLGRTGEVRLEEGDLALEGDGFELFGVLDHGTADVDADTGAASVRAVFTVDGAEGAPVEPGDTVTVDLRVEAETWSGEVRF